MFSKSLRRIFQTTKASRARYAAVFAVLVLALVIGAAQASGPHPQHPPRPPQSHPWWGMKMPSWRPWYPPQPVPKIKILAVEENDFVIFETQDFPEDQWFDVTMGKMYTRGVGGIYVGSFNSGDGSPLEFTATIPADLYDQARISIRAQTDHTYPYFAFNWFYNTTADLRTDDTMTPSPLMTEAEAESAQQVVEQPAEEEAVEAPAEGEEAEAPAEEETGEEGVGGAEGPQLTGVVWQWVEFSDPVQGTVTIDQPEQYTIEFMPEGLVGIKADCNNGSGTYIADEAGGIDIAIGAFTLALCAPESLSDQFKDYVNDAAVYSFAEDDLLLDLPVDTGTLRFAAEGAVAEETEGAVEETPAESEEAAEVETATSVAGTVTYVQRIALPDDAVVTVRIVNASLADTTEVLGEQVIETAGQQVPIPYEVAFNAEDINENLMYSVGARIEDGQGNLLFISDTAIPVITNDNPTQDVEIMTIPVSTGGAEEGAAEDESAATPEEGEVSLVGVTWNWSEFSDPVQGTLTIEDPTLYTATFFEDGTVAIKADCNNGSGSYVVDEGNIDITVGAVTMAACAEDSLSDQFLQYLDAAVIYFFEGGDLFMDLPVDSGTLRLVVGEAAEAAIPAQAVASASVIPVFSTAAGGGNGDENNGSDDEESNIPTFKICSVVRDETVYIVGENFPADQEFAVKMGIAPAYPPMPKPMPPMHKPMPPKPMPYQQGPMQPPMGGMWQKPMPMPKVWIPYYEAGTLQTGDGGAVEAQFEIPAELTGAYRISIMMRTAHQYPYISYNWFYNNTADVCNGD